MAKSARAARRREERLERLRAKRRRPTAAATPTTGDQHRIIREHRATAADGDRLSILDLHKAARVLYERLARLRAGEGMTRPAGEFRGMGDQ